MLISATGNVNISPAIRVPTRKILIAYSAIALCMYWEIAAAEVCLPSQRIQGLQPLSVSPSAGELWCNYGTLWRNPCGNSISRSGG